MKLRKTVAATALFALTSPVLAAEIPVIVKIPRMTMEAAEKLAHATVMACRKEGIQIGVTVVDRGGLPMAVLRDTLAPPVTLEVSRQKAYTAVNFNAPLSELEDRFTKPFSVGKVDGLLFSGGGLPIEAAGNIIGAVGVSGAPTAAQDEACARQGLDAIQLDLDMAQ